MHSVVATLPLLCCVALAGCTRRDKGGPLPRAAAHTVILISVDTLRADRLGCYGYHRPTSPNLDALARESLLFKNAVAQSAFTLISHKSLLSAKYPLHLLQETTNGDLRTLASVPDQHRLLVDSFRNLKSDLLIRAIGEGGYRTAAFTDGVWMSRWFGFDQGFDRFDDSGGHLEGIVPRALEWLGPNRRDPIFLFLHTYDTHCPYASREPFDSMFCHDHSAHISLERRCNLVNLGKTPLMQSNLAPKDLQAVSDHYDGGIACADADLGVLLDTLRTQGVYAEALIIVTSDHGESLGEHGQIGHGGLYLNQLRVPMIIKVPASWKIAPGVIDKPVDLLDVMPTVFDACHIPIPHGVDGRSLLPLMHDGEWKRRFLIAQTTHQEGRAARSSSAERAIVVPGAWLLIHDARNASTELFDLHSDPRGLVDVSDAKSDAIRSLMDALTSLDPGPSAGEFTIPAGDQLSDEARRQLETLGYIGH
ncbi:MAG: sulfatase [Phycisphaerae bacterium]